MSAYDVAVLGASWGGLDAVGKVLAGLPATFPAAVVVVQHRGSDSIDGVLEGVWRDRSPLAVREVDDKDPIAPGSVYVAPADYHLIVEPGTFALSVDERVQFSRPSIDVTFETAADSYGERVLAVLLTGANADGTAGMRRVRERGGCTVVQDPSTAERRDMPQAAIDSGVARHVVALDDIAGCLVRICEGERSAA